MKTWIARRDTQDGWTHFVICGEDGSERTLLRAQFPPNMTREAYEKFAEWLIEESKKPAVGPS
jgi:hypothetical protein